MIKKERRIPTILGLLIIFLGIGSTAFLVDHFQNIKAQARPSIIPQELKITNLTQNGFTVSWVTEERTTGFILFGRRDSLEKTALDERDRGRNLGKYFTHYVSVRNLKPASSYYFKIISQGKTFDQNGFPYEVKTLPPLPGSPPQIEPAYGTILNKDNTPAQGAIVYLTLKGALPLSALTKPSGNFLIPLNLAVQTNLKEYFVPKEEEEEDIVVRAGVEKIATAVTNTKNDSPIPTIILGKSYDFRSQKVKEEKSLARRRLSQKVLGEKEVAKEIEILFPKEGIALLDSRPLFKGKGIPRSEVIIKIESPPYIGRTVVDPNGRWFFRPQKPLSPGKHRVTIITKNERGEEVKISRSFLVLKSGSQVLGEATPSATLTPTPLPTITPTPSLAPLTPTPTIIPGVLTPTASFLGLGVLLLLVGAGMVFIF